MVDDFLSSRHSIVTTLKKFAFTNVKTANTPMETQKPLLKDEDGEEMDVCLYRSMIGSLMYHTSSRPDIMFASDHNLWDVIVNGDLEEEPSPTTGETSAPLAPKTAKQLAARRNQERVKSILLLAILDEYLLKFHNVADAKSLWEAIKSRVWWYENPEDGENIALIMRNKPDIDEINIDDLYNNLRVYKDELKRSSGSNSASQNLAFLSSENTDSTNEVSTVSGDSGVSTAGGINQVPSTLCAHDVAYSFLAQPTTSSQLKNEDFQQMDGDDLEELDL
ncbi:hypothetical protein Tco_1256090 [Tanacetum coccineum]